MGAGLAWQAKKLWPELPAWYGATLRAVLGLRRQIEPLPAEDKRRRGMPPVQHARLPLIFLPVKAMHLDGPLYSPGQVADLELIEQGVERLNAFAGPIALTMPGCGNGGLDPLDVLPILQKHLTDDRFVVVDHQAPVSANDA